MEKVISEDVFPCAPLQDDATTVNEDLGYEEANAIRWLCSPITYRESPTF